VGFRRVHGVGLAAGDPVGDPTAFDGSVRNFVRYCARAGWRPAVIGAREGTRRIYERYGLSAMYLGDEAIIDVRPFTLDGRKMRNVRQAVHRTENSGVTVEFHREGDVDDDLGNQLRSIADPRHAPPHEHGFSMALGGLLSGAFPDCHLVVARDRSRRPVAFQRYVTCRRGDVWSLDSMHWTPDAPNGVNERMINATVARCREDGTSELSLNFAAFRHMFDDQDTGSAGLLLLRRLDGRIGIQMDSLRRFNAKFLPRWVPRFLLYRNRRDLPAIGLAALSAEGFLPFDRTREREARP
jgi:lysyl-tRNA synthetase class 2